MSAPAGISIREFARRDGCNDKLVREAIKSGHLQPFSDGKLDPNLVGSDWRKANRRGADPTADKGADPADPPHFVRAPLSAPAEPGPRPEDRPLTDFGALESEQIDLLLRRGGMSLVEAERTKENALALKHILGARRAAGKIVDIAVAENVLFEGARAMRDAWLNWPARVGPLLAAELNVTADRVTEALTLYVHQHLAELGEPEANFESTASEPD